MEPTWISYLLFAIITISGILFSLRSMFGSFAGFFTFVQTVLLAKEIWGDVKEESENVTVDTYAPQRISIPRDLKEAPHPGFVRAYRIATLFGVGKYEYPRGAWPVVVFFPVIMLVHGLFGSFGLLILTAALYYFGISATRLYLEHKPDWLEHPVLIDTAAGMSLYCLCSSAFFDAETLDLWEWTLWYMLFVQTWHVWPLPWVQKKFSGITLEFMDDIAAVISTTATELAAILAATLIVQGAIWWAT